MARRYWPKDNTDNRDPETICPVCSGTKSKIWATCDDCFFRNRGYRRGEYFSLLRARIEESKKAKRKKGRVRAG